MTRKEIYDSIKAKNLVDKANDRARMDLYWVHNPNYTNLSNKTLLSILDTAKTKEKKEHVFTARSVDQGARRAILAIAATLNLKGIEKNFD